MRDRRAIVAGYGPVGRHTAEALSSAGFDITIIETNPATVEVQRGLGRRIIHGDAGEPRVLESAGIRGASAMVITIPEAEGALRACRAARELAPGIHIAVRACRLADGLEARDLGADSITVAEIETAISMARSVADLVGPACECGHERAQERAQGARRGREGGEG